MKSRSEIVAATTGFGSSTDRPLGGHESVTVLDGGSGTHEGRRVELLWRAVRWRWAASVATVLLSAVTVAGIVVGPLWTRAGSASVLHDDLSSAPPSTTAAQLEAHGVPSAAALTALEAYAQVHPLGKHDPAVGGLRIDAELLAPGSRVQYGTSLVYRAGACLQVTLVSGRCPTAAGEVLLERQSAQLLRAGTGAVLSGAVYGLTGQLPDVPEQVRVVGVYVPRDPSGSYWTGEYTPFQVQIDPESGNPSKVPLTLTDPATFDALASTPDQPLGYATVTRLVTSRDVGLADVAALRRETNADQRSVAVASTESFSLFESDGLLDVLDRAGAEGSALGRASTIVLAQLVLLSVAVLLLVVSASAAARAPEVAAARLRGLRPAVVVRLAVGEPLLLVLVGAPVGAAAAWGLVHAMAAYRLVDGTPVEVSGYALLALLAGVLAVVLAVLGACLRVLGRPVVELWSRTAPPPARAALRRDLGAVLAGVVVAVLCARSHGSVALLTPVPVSLVVALVGVRALPLACAPLLRRSRGRRRLAGFLAVRQLVRRREGALLTGLLVVAFGLAVTATVTSSVGRRAALLRGDSEVGAARVLQVQADVRHPDLDLRAAVRAADPTGRQAMAVAEYFPFAGEPGGRLLAVDSDRLAAVASWHDTVQGTSVHAVVAALQRPAVRTFPSAVLTREAAEDPRSEVVPGTSGHGQVVTFLDGHPHAVQVQAVVKGLPRVLGDGTLVDWAAFTSIPAYSRVSVDEVWLAAGAPASLSQRLTDQGLVVGTSESAAGRRAALSREGPALAVLLSLVGAVLALLLAAATTLFQVLTSARRRGFEVAALASLGVPLPVLRRAGQVETGLLVATGLALGVGAGAIASAASLAAVPLFSTDDVAVHVPLGPGPVATAVLLGSAALLGLVVSLAVGHVLLRAADPARLREVQA